MFVKIITQDSDRHKPDNLHHFWRYLHKLPNGNLSRPSLVKITWKCVISEGENYEIGEILNIYFIIGMVAFSQYIISANSSTTT